MAAKTEIPLPTVRSSEDTCPECRINHVEAPFDYCGMCEMLTLYFRERVATPEQKRDEAVFYEAYQNWRSILTWSQIVEMRDTYWTKARRAKAARGG